MDLRCVGGVTLAYATPNGADFVKWTDASGAVFPNSFTYPLGTIELTYGGSYDLTGNFDDSDGYNDHDFAKLRAFLEQESSQAGNTNGKVLNWGYNTDDPSTWSVTWSGGSPKRVTDINWRLKNIAGNLDVSGCTALTEIDCYSNKLQALDVSGCTALTEIKCNDNQLLALDISTNSLLETIYYGHNQLASLPLDTNTKLKEVYCEYNQLTSLDVSMCPNLENLYAHPIN